MEALWEAEHEKQKQLEWAEQAARAAYESATAEIAHLRRQLRDEVLQFGWKFLGTLRVEQNLLIKLL